MAKKKRDSKRKMWLYAVGQFLLTLFYYPVFRMRVRGRENIPRGGPVLLCCNHAAKRDPVMLGVSVTRQVFYMAKEELFQGRFLGGLLRRLGAFPVLRGSGGADALQEAVSHQRTLSVEAGVEHFLAQNCAYGIGIVVVGGS